MIVCFTSSSKLQVCDRGIRACCRILKPAQFCHAASLVYWQVHVEEARDMSVHPGVGHGQLAARRVRGCRAKICVGIGAHSGEPVAHASRLFATLKGAIDHSFVLGSAAAVCHGRPPAPAGREHAHLVVPVVAPGRAAPAAGAARSRRRRTGGHHGEPRGLGASPGAMARKVGPFLSRDLYSTVSTVHYAGGDQAAGAHFLGFRTGAGAVVAHFLIRGRPQTEGQIRRGWICVKYHET